MSLLLAVDEGRPSDGVGHVSWATSNEAMFARILDLYARPGMTIADVTYGHGTFWRSVNEADYDLRASDINDGTDARALPYADASMDLWVFDPPYRYVEKRTVAGHTHEQYGLESLRPDRAGIDGVLDLYDAGITEGARVLRLGGYAVVKCQDTAGDGRQTWVHDHVMDSLTRAGLTPIDLAVVVTASPPPTRWKVQRSLRKAHSYFVIARKGGFYPFGYKSVQQRRSDHTGEGESEREGS